MSLIMNKNFKLKEFSLEFKKGYSFEKEEEKQKDRYEGKVSFFNEIGESFTLCVDEGLSLDILKIISKKLSENTDKLVKNIINSI